MALKGTLSFEGSSKEYTVLECEYDFEQSTDIDGRPDDGVRGGKIYLTIATPAMGSTFYEWMFHDFQQRDGVITLNVNSDSNSFVSRYIVFECGYCVGLHDYFNNNNSIQMTTRITIQAARIVFCDCYGSGTGIDIFMKKLVDGNYETVFKNDGQYSEDIEGSSKGMYKFDNRSVDDTYAEMMNNTPPAETPTPSGNYKIEDNGLITLPKKPTTSKPETIILY